MKTLLIKSLIIFLVSAVLEFFYEFWIIMGVALVVNLIISSNGGLSALSGFLGVGILWMVAATYIDVSSGSVLTGKIADIMGVSGPVLHLISTLVGAICGGIGAYTGYSIRKLIPSSE